MTLNELRKQIRSTLEKTRHEYREMSPDGLEERLTDEIMTSVALQNATIYQQLNGVIYDLGVVIGRIRHLGDDIYRSTEKLLRENASDEENT